MHDVVGKLGGGAPLITVSKQINLFKLSLLLFISRFYRLSPSHRMFAIVQ